MPSLETLDRLARACGRRLRFEAELEADPHDVELADGLLALEPLERLRALRRYVRMRSLAEEGG